MLHSLNYGNTTLEYSLDFASRKTLAIDVHPDLSITVTAPEGTPLPQIESRLRQRGPWILRQLRELETYLPHLPPRLYVSGESHRYLGKQYRLKVIAAATEEVKLTRGQIFVYTREKEDCGRVKILLTNWYRQHAQHVFAERIEVCLPRVARFGIGRPEWEIRQMEKRWGSCTPGGKVLLNLTLIQVAKPLIDYVIMHELCHLKEHHHGTAFYTLLDRTMPDWRERRQKLNIQDVA